VRAHTSSVFALLAALSASPATFAQAPRQAQPAAAPNAALPAPGAPRQPQGQTAAGNMPTEGSSTIALRDAPHGSNPVLAAFTPKAGGLTANDVAVRAVATSDTIAAKSAELRAAAAAVDSAMYQFYPRVALKASYTRLSPVTLQFGPQPINLPVNAYSLGASLGVPISDYVLRLSDSIDAT
jgi:outer membrane protein